MGNLLAVVVHVANIHDTKPGIHPATKAFEKTPSIKRFCADAGYRKFFEEDVWEVLGLGVDISEKIKPHEWEKLPGGGSWNVPWPGSEILAAFPRTMNYALLPRKL